MSEQTDYERLKALAGSPKTGTAKVRAALDDIERALAAGHSLEEIVEALGVDMKLNGFKTALRRVREERRKMGADKATDPPAVQPVNTITNEARPVQQTDLVKTEPEETGLSGLAKILDSQKRGSSDKFEQYSAAKKPLGGKIK